MLPISCGFFQGKTVVSKKKTCIFFPRKNCIFSRKNYFPRKKVVFQELCFFKEKACFPRKMCFFQGKTFLKEIWEQTPKPGYQGGLKHWERKNPSDAKRKIFLMFIQPHWSKFWVEFWGQEIKGKKLRSKTRDLETKI